MFSTREIFERKITGTLLSPSIKDLNKLRARLSLPGELTDAQAIETLDYLRTNQLWVLYRFKLNDSDPGKDHPLIETITKTWSSDRQRKFLSHLLPRLFQLDEDESLPEDSCEQIILSRILQRLLRKKFLVSRDQLFQILQWCDRETKPDYSKYSVWELAIVLVAWKRKGLLDAELIAVVKSLCGKVGTGPANSTAGMVERRLRSVCD